MTTYKVPLEAITGKNVDLHPLRNKGDDHYVIRDEDLTPIPPGQRGLVLTLYGLPEYQEVSV